MSKFAYVNGKYLNVKNAKISVNDRSMHFSDAVYEVIAVYQGKLVFWKDHVSRLKKSLNMLEIKNFNNILEINLVQCFIHISMYLYIL